MIDINQIEYTFILGERNSGTRWLTQILRQYNTFPVYRNFKHSYPTKKLISSPSVNIGKIKPKHQTLISPKCLNVLIVRNVFTWCERMATKPYHYDKTPLIELLTTPFRSEMEIPGKYCEGDIQDFEEVDPSSNIIDMRIKKYNKWLELLHDHNLVIINYDKLLEQNPNELSKLQKVCSKKVSIKPQPLQIRQSHYLNSAYLRKYNKECYDIILEKIDLEFEKKMGFEWDL